MFEKLRFKRESRKTLTHPDAIVVTEKAKVFRSNYRVRCLIREKYPTMVLLKTIGDGPSTRHQMCFPAPQKYPRTLWVGRRLELHEARYFVDTVTVEEICNPLLARTFPNREGLLQDAALCNTAMSRIVYFGPDLVQPTDNKLMAALPDLSGEDIDALAAYVTAVREDVHWNIYYPNWDRKADDLTIDGMAEARAKYPWLSEENLRALHSTGTYYAWHG